MNASRLHVLDWIDADLAQLASEGLLRKQRCVRPLPGGMCEIEGRRLWNFAANDYLDLACEPRVLAAAQQALTDAGAGATASALVSGRTPWHAALEQEIAKYLRAEAALLFPTGYAANVGTISALAAEDDVIFCDRSNHASLLDGCRLSGAQFRVYRHDDLAGLMRALDRAAARRRWIVTDTLFSMEGDLAPLQELCEIADRFDVGLIIDEAHALGALGPTGRGGAEHANVAARIPVRIATFSKAFGSLGGCVAGERRLIDWLWNRARPQMFSTALPPSACAAATAALQIADAEPKRRDRLTERGAQLRAGLRAMQLETTSEIGPIVPVIVESAERVMQIAAGLESAGFLVGAIRPPTVPRNTSRLRITLNANQPPQAIDDLLAALAKLL